MKTLKVIGYWLIHIIWAAPTFVLGLLVVVFMLLTGNKPKRFGYTFYFTPSFMHNCGFSLGPIFCVAEDSQYLYMYQHEHGHAIQTLWWGPLTLFVISIPSMVRFCYRDYKEDKMMTDLAEGRITQEEFNTWRKNRPAYNSIWFEKQATELGQKLFPTEES